VAQDRGRAGRIGVISHHSADSLFTLGYLRVTLGSNPSEGSS
jgi:hypothetical protein